MKKCEVDVDACGQLWVQQVMKLAAGMAGDGLLSSRDCVDLVNTLRARYSPTRKCLRATSSSVASHAHACRWLSLSGKPKV